MSCILELRSPINLQRLSKAFATLRGGVPCVCKLFRRIEKIIL